MKHFKFKNGQLKVWRTIRPGGTFDGAWSARSTANLWGGPGSIVLSGYLDRDDVLMLDLKGDTAASRAALQIEQGTYDPREVRKALGGDVPAVAFVGGLFASEATVYVLEPSAIKGVHSVKAGKSGYRRNPRVKSKLASLGMMNDLREKHGGRTKAYYAAVLKEVKAGVIAPSAVVGGGYKNGKKVAIMWLEEQMKNAMRNPRGRW